MRSAIIEATEAIAQDREAIHQLHEHQVWRLVHWRAAREQLTYRRFFEIADLVGVRVESQRVFDDVHGLALSLVASATSMASGSIMSTVSPIRAVISISCRRQPASMTASMW